MNLIQLLVQKGVLKEADVPLLRDKLGVAGSKPFHLVMLDHGFAREEDLLPVLAEQLGMEVVDLTKTTLSPEVMRVVPAKLVHRKSLLPLSRENGSLTVATADPFDVASHDEVTRVDVRSYFGPGAYEPLSVSSEPSFVPWCSHDRLTVDDSPYVGTWAEHVLPNVARRDGTRR